jgi:hypothetical protein
MPSEGKAPSQRHPRDTGVEGRGKKAAPAITLRRGLGDAFDMGTLRQKKRPFMRDHLDPAMRCLLVKHFFTSSRPAIFG